jgi:cyanophycinase
MSKGKLIIIGGHEDKVGDETILKEVVNTIKKDGRLVIATVASTKAQEVGTEYTALFKELGVKNVAVLNIEIREEAFDEARVKLIDEADAVFFTGGDQLRITSQVGDTPIYRGMHALYKRGGLIAGTSAGAAVMPHTMLISGPSDESSRMSAIEMAPGFAFIENVVIDSHFAERGRMGRLIGAVIQNPANLGIGIDEDTAIVVEQGKRFRVIGSGAVYVLDGSTLTYSSVSEEQPEGILSAFDLRLHVLGDGDQYNLLERHPLTTEVSTA